MNDDDPTRGSNQIGGISGEMYDSVTQPNDIETVIAKLPTGPDGALEQWKDNHYFDNPDFWSTPGEQDVVIHTEGKLDKPGTCETTTTVKTVPESEEIEVYNISQDPTEMVNLASSGEYAAIVGQLAVLLAEQRQAKRISPRGGLTRGSRPQVVIPGVGV